MGQEYLYLEFVYPQKDSQELLNDLEDALTECGKIESSQMMIEPRNFGDIEILSYDGMADSWPLDEGEFTYEAPEQSVNLSVSPIIEFSVSDLQYLTGGPEHPLDVGPDEPLRELLDILTFCYTTTEERPIAVYSTTPDTPLDLRKPPITAESIANGKLTYLPWLTIFTPEMVEEYGRETLLSAPAWKVEELEDGSVLLVCHDDVGAWDNDCRPVAQHLGLPSYRELG